MIKNKHLHTIIKVRSNLRTNLIVLKKKDKQKKEVEIPLETEKIELLLS